MATILVVDDEPDIRLLVRMTLEGAGHEVIEAGDGSQAMSVVRSESPDLVLLDVMMPDTDGWTVLQEIKDAEDRRVAEMPVLMLTALSGAMDRVKGGVGGAVRYLTKPIDLDELRVAVEEALAVPELPQRRKAATSALEMLARIEVNASDRAPDRGPRPRLSALEHSRGSSRVETPASLHIASERLGQLTDKQRTLLGAVQSAPTVLEAATRLHMSRSNVYASLRRISRKLGTTSVPELLDLLRNRHLLG